MADVFENIFGQAQVRDLLRASVAHQHVSHTYLFSGPAGSNKTQAAYALAASLVCAQAGCGTCPDCKQVLRHAHPDVHYYEPEGAHGYLVSQIRQIVSDMALSSIRSKTRIYILNRVDLLGTSAANAFLKTLEEPPDDVVIILLGRTRESVLPTIVSRCVLVPFRQIPEQEAAALLSQRTGSSTEQARMALAACGGSITQAVEFLLSSERMAFRKKVLDLMCRLDTLDGWDVITASSDVVVSARAPLDSLRIQQAEELKNTQDYFESSARRQLEQRHTRELSARGLEYFASVFAIIASYLRDLMYICAHTPELITNTDFIQDLKRAAEKLNAARVAQALACVATAQKAIIYNVSSETCLNALLFEIGDILYGSHSSC